ncbi:MAG: hypothetical protein IIX39_00540 [Clostridia bacterium]|nr:hypothetical protein [Clostridia bacterium]
MKKVILSLTALACVFATVTACSKSDNEKYAEYVTDENGAYVTDANGELQTTILDSEEVSVEYITDDSGKKTIDDNGDYKTVVHHIVTDENGQTKDIANTTLSVDDVTDSIGTEDIINATTETTVQIEKTTQTSARLYEKKVLPIIKSGKFTMKFSVSSNFEGVGNMVVPVVVACDDTNNRFFFETRFSAIKMQYILKNDKMYMVFPSMRSYTETEYGSEGDDISQMIKDITNGMASTKSEFIGTSKAKYKGVECVCEEYKEDNLVYRYFFRKSDSKFIRLEMIDTQTKESTVINFDSLSAGVAESYFNIPKSYKKVDMDSLADSLGNIS